MTRPKMQGQCCGNCKWLKTNPNNMTKHSPPRWRSGSSVGQCVWPMPIPLPISITRNPGYRPERSHAWMRVDAEGCPTWEAYEQEAEG